MSSSCKISIEITPDNGQAFSANHGICALLSRWSCRPRIECSGLCRALPSPSPFRGANAPSSGSKATMVTQSTLMTDFVQRRRSRDGSCFCGASDTHITGIERCRLQLRCEKRQDLSSFLGLS